MTPREQAAIQVKQNNETPPCWAVHTAVKAAMFSPCRSQRGVVVYDQTGVLGSGYNSKPKGFECDGSAACKANCRNEAVHAEQSALLASRGRLTGGAILIHVKVVDGELVASGGPSCVQCSKLILHAGIEWVWLYHVEGWRRYHVAEFHRLSLEAGAQALDAGHRPPCECSGTRRVVEICADCHHPIPVRTGDGLTIPAASKPPSGSQQCGPELCEESGLLAVQQAAPSPSLKKDENDFSAGLIGRTIPDMAGTEPRLSIDTLRAHVVAELEITDPSDAVHAIGHVDALIDGVAREAFDAGWNAVKWVTCNQSPEQEGRRAAEKIDRAIRDLVLQAIIEARIVPPPLVGGDAGGARPSEMVCEECGEVENNWRHAVTHGPMNLSGAHKFRPMNPCAAGESVGRTPEWRENAFAGRADGNQATTQSSGLNRGSEAPKTDLSIPSISPCSPSQRDRRAPSHLYEGDITVGMHFIWEKGNPRAWAHVVVIEVVNRDGHDNIIWTETIPSGAKSWNEESRCREAFTPCDVDGSPLSPLRVSVASAEHKE